MADLYMPRSIPNPALDSMQWTPAFDNVLRTQVGTGAFKTRRLTSRALEQLTCSLYLDQAELAVLFDFYSISCREVLRFYWWDLRWPSLTDRYAIYTWMARPGHSLWEQGIFKVDITLLMRETYSGNFLLDFYDSQVWPTL